MAGSSRGQIPHGQAAVDTMNTSRFLGPFATIWQFRELFRQLVQRNLKVRYQRSGLGFLWLLVNPLVTVGILVLVFGHIVALPVHNYWAFLVSGYFCWVFLLHTVSASTFVIPDHASMAKSVAVPANVFVMAAITSRLFEFLAEICLVVVALVVFHHHGVPSSLVLLPLLVVLLVLTTLGIALPAAALSVFFRDIQHGLPPALMMLMYVSPVFYPAAFVPAALAPFYQLNPVALILSLFHRILYEGLWPSPQHLIGAIVVSLSLYLVGHAVFRRHQSLFAEIV